MVDRNSTNSRRCVISPLTTCSSDRVKGNWTKERTPPRWRCRATRVKLRDTKLSAMDRPPIETELEGYPGHLVDAQAGTRA